MKKKIASHKFTKNKKEISVYYVENEKAYPKVDCLSLEFKTPEEIIKIGIRPDEALLIIRILAEAVFKIVKGYKIELIEQ